MHSENQFHCNIPPEEVRLFRPSQDNLVETPLDHRGIVDLEELIKLVKSTVISDYNWPSSLNDVHHLQWHASLYSTHTHPVIASEFRNLVNRKAYVPRNFHNWIHRITVPPPLPSVEVMHHSIEAQRVALSLFETASRAQRLVRSKKMGEAALRIKLENAFEYYNGYLDNAREVPQEFSLIKVEDLEVESIGDMLTASTTLGRMALNQIPRKIHKIKKAA